MQLLNEQFPGMVAALTVSALLVGFQADFSCAQQNVIRTSRYRLVESLEAPPTATKLKGTEQAPQLEFDDAIPEPDRATTADFVVPGCGVPRSNIRASEEAGRANSVFQPCVKSVSYSGATSGKSKQSGWLNQPQGWNQSNVYDSSATHPDQFAAPAQFPFRDQYQSFPPRAGFGALYGETVNDSPEYGNPETMFGVHQSECCDEWNGFCPCVETDYVYSCGGLKANPGHCIFKLASSGEPCDESLGCGLLSKCRFGKKGCKVNDYQRANRGSRCSSDRGCGCAATSQTATERRCPLLTSLGKKCHLKERRPVKNVGQSNQSYCCESCQPSCSTCK